jgi:GPH family glycoside/pentoside/hexuronide:cation symporter
MTNPAHAGVEQNPVSVREIMAYSLACLCNGLAGAAYNLMTPLVVLTLGMSPVLAGLIMAIKTMWDAFTDPLMATITDNANTRWGRRRPFILAGGLLLVAICVALWFGLPAGDRAKLNAPAEPAVAAAPAQGAATPTPAAAPARPPAPKGFGKVWSAGWEALKETPAQERHIFLYLTIGMMLVATAHTIFSVPYYALGIELSPTYHGRTRVVAYRSIFEKLLGLTGPWYLPFCMLAVFRTAIDGAAWLMVIMAVLAVPALVATVALTQERTKVDRARKKVAMFSSIALTLKNRHFLKVAALYIVLQLALGLFLQFGLYINIFHVFGGDRETAMKVGAVMQAKVSSLGSILALLSIPAVTWLCKQFQKHNALRLALGMMVAGCLLNWVCYQPGHPNLQYILPFFFSLGISSTYTVLGTLMADVTDIDELNSGSRREGMFGAVMAWMSKGVGSIQALVAGGLLVATGFDAQASVQTPETILNMRVLFSFAPAIVLAAAIGLLYRYPLTRERMEEIKGLLEARRAAAHPAPGA